MNIGSLAAWARSRFAPRSDIEAADARLDKAVEKSQKRLKKKAQRQVALGDAEAAKAEEKLRKAKGKSRRKG